jgi:hypothetical protein
MKIIFDAYSSEEPIPVTHYLKNKKLGKYFNRETAAAIVCASKLLRGVTLPSATPFFYATGTIEYEDYGLNYIAQDSGDEQGKFSPSGFIEKGLSRVPPINQFKVLQNMPLCFIAIEHHLTGENAVVYSAAASLLLCVLYAERNQNILLGAGKVYQNGETQVGFALVDKLEIVHSPFLSWTGEAIEMLQTWAHTA